MDQRKQIYNFLKLNGWKRDFDSDSEYKSFNKEGAVSIDIGKDEIVFVGDIGDFAHIPLNFYALVGFIYVNRLVPIKLAEVKDV